MEGVILVSWQSLKLQKNFPLKTTNLQSLSAHYESPRLISRNCTSEVLTSFEFSPPFSWAQFTETDSFSLSVTLPHLLGEIIAKRCFLQDVLWGDFIETTFPEVPPKTYFRSSFPTRGSSKPAACAAITSYSRLA